MTGRWHRLRDRETGLVPRIRLAVGVLASSVGDRRQWRSLPIDFATALLAPIRVPGPPAPPMAARDWSPEREAAGARLRRAAQRWANERTARPAFAVIADDDDLAAWGRSGCLIEVRPEDWAVVLERTEAAGSPLGALLVTSTRAGNHGAWAFRLGAVAHPDAFLERDVAALVAWFADRGLPSIFLVTDDRPGAATDWGAVGRLFDLVLAPSEDLARALSARPDRRGIEARVSTAAGLEDVLAAIGSPA